MHLVVTGVFGTLCASEQVPGCPCSSRDSRILELCQVAKLCSCSASAVRVWEKGSKTNGMVAAWV